MVPWCGQIGVAGWVGMVALWLLVVAVAIWAVTRLFPVQRGATAALDVLDERLARGDIDASQYRLVRQELDRTPGNGAAGRRDGGGVNDRPRRAPLDR